MVKHSGDWDCRKNLLNMLFGIISMLKNVDSDLGHGESRLIDTLERYNNGKFIRMF